MQMSLPSLFNFKSRNFHRIILKTKIINVISKNYYLKTKICTFTTKMRK